MSLPRGFGSGWDEPSSTTSGPKKRTLKEKMHLRTLPFFRSSGDRTAVGYNVALAVEMISKNRSKIPDRYWDGTNLNIAEETTKLERQSDLVTEFTMIGRKGELCRLKVSTDQYEDIHECESAEFGELVLQLRLNNTDARKLSELYILTKDDLEVPDLLFCENMEIRRDAIKRMGYDRIREYSILVDSFDDYDLIDLRCSGVDFGRYLKMVDSTSKQTYLLKVPRVRDFGTVKIRMDKATEAVAWSFKKQEHEYRPETET